MKFCLSSTLLQNSHGVGKVSSGFAVAFGLDIQINNKVL